MENIKTFKSYNFVTGAVDGTLAYDFGNPDSFAEPKRFEYPGDAVPAPESPEWVQDAPRETEKKSKTKVRKKAAVRAHRIPVFGLMGYACVVVMCIVLMLAQIQMVGLSSTAEGLESQIAELQTEKDKLTAEYETIFNLTDVEEYAESILGMQQPMEDQIYYLSGVSSGDKAVVINNDDTNLLSIGLEDLKNSVKAFVNGIFNRQASYTDTESDGE